MNKKIQIMLCLFCLFISQVTIVKATEDTDTDDTNNSNISVFSGEITGNWLTSKKLIEEYNFKYKTGHGFAAEYANNLNDQMKGINSQVVGGDCIKDGADRVITYKNGNKVWIQDKYYSTAAQSIEACFDVDTGKFRYYDPDGLPMQIEVPKNQYENAVKKLQEKISQGLIDGVTDPEEAKNIVRPGNITYQQAKNIAEAGNIDSLLYDAKTGIISSTCAFGISTVIDYIVCINNGMTPEEALNTAALNGIKTGGIVFATTIISGQLNKTHIMDVFIPSSEAMAKALGDDFCEAIIKTQNTILNTPMNPSNTSNAAKILRTNLLIDGVVVVVLSIEDVVDIFKGRISKEQFIKNISIHLVGTAGGTIGAYAGSALGGTVVPGIGNTVGAILGGIVLGTTAEITADTIISLFYEGDIELMMDVVSEEFKNLSQEYLITEEEGNNITKELKTKLTGDVLKDMYASEDKNTFAREIMEELFKNECKNREEIKLPTEDEMRIEVKNSLTDVVYIH